MSSRAMTPSRPSRRPMAARSTSQRDWRQRERRFSVSVRRTRRPEPTRNSRWFNYQWPPSHDLRGYEEGGGGVDKTVRDGLNDVNIYLHTLDSFWQIWRSGQVRL